MSHAAAAAVVSAIGAIAVATATCLKQHRKGIRGEHAGAAPAAC